MAQAHGPGRSAPQAPAFQAALQLPDDFLQMLITSISQSHHVLTLREQQERLEDLLISGGLAQAGCGQQGHPAFEPQQPEHQTHSRGGRTATSFTDHNHHSACSTLHHDTQERQQQQQQQDQCLPLHTLERGLSSQRTQLHGYGGLRAASRTCAVLANQLAVHSVEVPYNDLLRHTFALAPPMVGATHLTLHVGLPSTPRTMSQQPQPTAPQPPRNAPVPLHALLTPVTMRALRRHFPSLKHLHLTHAWLSPPPDALPSSATATAASASYHPLDLNGLASLSLECVRLPGLPLSPFPGGLGPSLAAAAAGANLTRLELVGLTFNGSDGDALGRLTSLQDLTIRNCTMASPRGLTCLGQLTHLTRLGHVHVHYEVPVPHELVVLSRLTALREADLRSCDAYEDEVVAWSTWGPSLTSLRLSSMYLPAQRGASRLLPSLTSLVVLELREVALTPHTWAGAVVRMAQLRHLHVGWLDMARNAPVHGDGVEDSEDEEDMEEDMEQEGHGPGGMAGGAAVAGAAAAWAGGGGGGGGQQGQQQAGGAVGPGVAGGGLRLWPPAPHPSLQVLVLDSPWQGNVCAWPLALLAPQLLVFRVTGVHETLGGVIKDRVPDTAGQWAFHNRGIFGTQGVFNPWVPQVKYPQQEQEDEDAGWTGATPPLPPRLRVLCVPDTWLDTLLFVIRERQAGYAAPLQLQQLELYYAYDRAHPHRDMPLPREWTADELRIQRTLRSTAKPCPSRYEWQDTLCKLAAAAQLEEAAASGAAAGAGAGAGAGVGAGVGATKPAEAAVAGAGAEPGADVGAGAAGPSSSTVTGVAGPHARPTSGSVPGSDDAAPPRALPAGHVAAQPPVPRAPFAPCLTALSVPSDLDLLAIMPLCINLRTLRVTRSHGEELLALLAHGVAGFIGESRGKAGNARTAAGFATAGPEMALPPPSAAAAAAVEAAVAAAAALAAGGVEAGGNQEVTHGSSARVLPYLKSLELYGELRVMASAQEEVSKGSGSAGGRGNRAKSRLRGAGGGAQGQGQAQQQGAWRGSEEEYDMALLDVCVARGVEVVWLPGAGRGLREGWLEECRARGRGEAAGRVALRVAVGT